jgi:hypothetical protein
MKCYVFNISVPFTYKGKNWREMVKESVETKLAALMDLPDEEWKLTEYEEGE